jgi:hypothetical protein
MSLLDHKQLHKSSERVTLFPYLNIIKLKDILSERMVIL